MKVQKQNKRDINSNKRQLKKKYQNVTNLNEQKLKKDILSLGYDKMLSLGYGKMVYENINDVIDHFVHYLKTKKGKSISVTTKLLLNNYQKGTWNNLVHGKNNKQLKKLLTFIQSPQQRRKISQIMVKVKKFFSTVWKKKDLTGFIITQLLDVSTRTIEINLNMFEKTGLAKVFDGDTKSLLIKDFHDGIELARVFVDDSGKKYHSDVERLVIEMTPSSNKEQHEFLKYVIEKMKDNNETSEVKELYLTPNIIKKYKPELYENFLDTEVTIKLHNLTNRWENIVYNLMANTYAVHKIAQQIMSFVSPSYETSVFCNSYSYKHILKDSFFSIPDTDKKKIKYFSQIRNKIHKSDNGYDQSEESLLNTLCQIFFFNGDFKIDNLNASYIPNVLATPFNDEALKLSKDTEKKWEESTKSQQNNWVEQWRDLVSLIKKLWSLKDHIKMSQTFIDDMESQTIGRVNIEIDNGNILNINTTDSKTSTITYKNNTLKKFKFSHSDYQQLLHIWLFTLAFIYNNKQCKELDKRNINEVYTKILNIYKDEWLDFLFDEESLDSISDKCRQYNERTDVDGNLIKQQPICAFNVLMNVKWDLNVLTKIHTDFYTKRIKKELDDRFIKNKPLAKIRDEYSFSYKNKFKKTEKESYRITSDGIIFSWSKTDAGHGDRTIKDTERNNLFWEYKTYNQKIEKIYNKDPKLATFLSYNTCIKLLNASVSYNQETLMKVNMGESLSDDEQKLYDHHQLVLGIKKNIEFDYEWLYNEKLSPHFLNDDAKCSDYLLGDVPNSYKDEKEQRYESFINSLGGNYFKDLLND